MFIGKQEFNRLIFTEQHILRESIGSTHGIVSYMTLLVHTWRETENLRVV